MLLNIVTKLVLIAIPCLIVVSGIYTHTEILLQIFRINFMIRSVRLQVRLTIALSRQDAIMMAIVKNS